jgi:hypothetical protein
VELSHTARALIVRLALHQDIQEQSCAVKYDTLAEEVGLCERTTMRLLALGEARGWFVMERRPGQGGTNNSGCSCPQIWGLAVSR